MITHQQNIFSPTGAQITFQEVFSALDLPALDWLVTDLWIRTKPGSGVDALEWESKVAESSDPGMWCTDDEVLAIVRATEQLIDGEFLGCVVNPRRAERGRGIDEHPVVRIDFFDSSSVTVSYDETAIGTSAETESLLGPGVHTQALVTRVSGPGNEN